MDRAFIKAISYYLPEDILTNNDLVRQFPEWTVDKIASKVGVNNRHIAADNETATDLAIKVGAKLFQVHPDLRKDHIDFVIFCTQSPDYYLPTSACIIQHRLGLRTDIGALDYNLGCSGYVYGLALAKGLIVAGVATNVLLLTAETYSKYLHPKDKGNRTIFGDAASATLVSVEGTGLIGDFSLGTDGRGAENLIVRSGCARQKKSVKDLAFDESGNPISSDYLYMNGSEIFSFTQENVPIVIRNTLQKNRIQQEQIDLFIFHQANKYMLNFLRKKLHIPEDHFYIYLENVGNTVSSSIPIALCEALKENKISPGAKILLAGFGVGYSWGGTILEF